MRNTHATLIAATLALTGCSITASKSIEDDVRRLTDTLIESVERLTDKLEDDLDEDDAEAVSEVLDEIRDALGSSESGLTLSGTGTYSTSGISIQIANFGYWGKSGETTLFRAGANASGTQQFSFCLCSGVHWGS